WYRYDPGLVLTNVVMRDDGTGGDLVAGDGVYSGVIPGRTAGIAAFRVEATDAAVAVSTNVFPPLVPAQECLIRWGETIPVGSFGHYHLWSTAATEAARGGSTSLNNMYRDGTLVYGNGRIIYDAGFRDKGSPYHSGQGDFALTVANDDLLLGVNDRVFGATGNGGAESTELKGRIANWFCGQLGIPFLHAHYILLYRNGSPHAPVTEDNEQPSNYFAGSWFPSGIAGELYKIAVWFEDDSTSGAIGATMEQFKTVGGGYDLARYRFNWQLRATDSANDYTNLFKLVDAVNAPGDHVPGLVAIADMEQWMRVFAYHRMMGNWDSWTFRVGQNMFLYRQPGGRWVLMPWDIDFVLGEGDGPTADLITDIQDPIAGPRFYNNFTFRRMFYRAFQDAIAGPMQPSRYGPQVEARKQILIKNRIGATPPSDVNSYIDQRRETVRALLAAQDVGSLTITNNNGNDFIAGSSVVTLAGKAPFAVATIEINGIPYPVKWTGYNSFAITVPLGGGANVLNVVGRDLRGKAVASGSDTITITYNGVPQQPQDFVVINELQYNPLYPRGSFIELYNRSLTTPFDLSGYRLSGVGYTFPEGSFIAPNSFLVLAKDRAAFYNAYGSDIVVLDEFPGSLSGGGEHIQLIKPGATPDQDLVINDVRYDNVPPWPLNADGFGPSLQLIDATIDSYRVGNWAATATNALKQTTPGRTNSTRQVLAPFPLVWLNEVLPRNVKSQVDNNGEHDPFVELYNSGDTVVDLSAYYLTDTYTNLTKWQFPAGATIPAKGFITLWADGQAAQTAPGSIHTPFKLDPVAGSLALVRMQGSPSIPAVMDYLNYSGLPADQSYGSYPDGEPRDRRSFYYPTASAANNPVYPDLKVTINEVMADNQKTILDTASGKYSDWFELYNGGSTVVDLTNYRLTDNLTNTTRYVIPSGYTIPAGGFLLVWADGDTSLNQPSRPDLHVNFKLSKSGKSVGLFAPDNRLVDGFSFGAQIPDMSLGRFPDGATTGLIYMPLATPRKKNDATDANLPPVLNPILAKVVDELTPLSLNVVATDPNPGQSLTYSLINNPPSGAAIDAVTGSLKWTADESQGPGDYVLTVQVTDNGVPPLSVTADIHVHVNEVNTPPGIQSIGTQVGASDVPLHFFVVAIDSDIPAQQITFSLPPGSPLGAAINPSTGEFSWTPTSEQGGDYDMIVILKDDGTPPLSQAFHIPVKIQGPAVVPSPVILATRAPDGTLTLSWAAVNGVRYHVEFTETLGTLSWNPLGDAIGDQGVAGLSGIELNGVNERYYRVVVVQYETRSATSRIC
ncbi:MAG: lamin tail domain-containing protein, partial [Verrucomicrobia bacterium]|nr:lamin tail domain-containing protein [Verrucomicrobiota bacterium]